jgi:proline dehydrogenase
MSESPSLRETLPRYRLVKKAVKRFMPGEELGDAVDAASTLRNNGFPVILTKLGENILRRNEAEAVAAHYMEVLEQVSGRSIDAFISVKLTQLGLDIDRELCFNLVRRLALKAKQHGTALWIDMEQSRYVDLTIGLYEQARAEYDSVGICLQSYLYRTEADLKRLLSVNARIRLVKGAYNEPAAIAYPKKVDVDASFFLLAQRLLEHTRATKTVHGIGTHDITLIRRIIKHASTAGMSPDQYEIQMLYGIRTGDQEQLRKEGFRVRVLISYGTYWYPWYMRRLAERPANVWFVVKNVLTWRL